MSTAAIDLYARPSTQSPALKVDVALNRFLTRLQHANIQDELALARRRAAARQIKQITREITINTRAGFEAVLNGCLDVGYRDGGLLAFIFEVIGERISARIRRRLRSVGASLDEVSDLLSKTMESIHRLLSRANRVRHTLRYELLITIGDHRAIDFLRRRRLEYRDDLESFVDGGADPERQYQEAQRDALARQIRDAVYAANNQLPERQRRALIEVELRGRGYEEIARLLSISPANVGNVVRRARAARTRALTAQLRGLEALKGAAGYTALSADPQLRREMLRWASEIGAAPCPQRLSEGYLQASA